ncbi:DoxX family protein [bacterium]|nr:DoxX family protein [candidate division CSSED10-310 bacterium]
MRMAVGFLFLWHGSQKLLNFPPAGYSMPAHIQFVAGPVELIGGFLIMTGLLTRISAFVASGQMAFAYWLAHGTHALLPIQNQGELAALYCFVFLAIWARGPGRWAVENLLKNSG